MYWQQYDVTRVATASVMVMFCVAFAKYLAYFLTGSFALLSDALESTINVVTACIARWMIRIAEKPADDGHHFGHHKAEYFSSLLEGLLIIAAAILIIYQAYYIFFETRILNITPLALLIGAVALTIHGFWGYFLIKFSVASRSQALRASAKHLFSDVASSIAVIGGLYLTSITGWLFLDALLSIGVALNILREGVRVVSDSIRGLMDSSVPEEMNVTIREIIGKNAKGVIEVHDLKTRIAGSAVFLEFHMIVPGATKVSESHAICNRLEAALHDQIPKLHVLIHVEPEEERKVDWNDQLAEREKDAGGIFQE